MVEIFRKVLPKSPVQPRAPVDDPGTVTRVEDALIEAHRLNAELRPVEAIAMFRRALALDPANSTAVSELGATLVDAGQSEEGLALFVEHLDRHPQDAEARLAYAGSLLRSGSLLAALAECRRCLELRPNWDAPYPPMIRTLHRLGEKEAAAGALQAFGPLAKDPRIVAMLETMLQKDR